MTPTDIDGCLDYKDRLWVVLEFKYGDAPLPKGQELALQRLCRSLSKDKPTLGIIASHRQSEYEKIDGANATVTQVYENGRFERVRVPHTVRTLIDMFIRDNEVVKKVVQPPELDDESRRLEELARTTNWRIGIQCGISGEVCKWCRGVPCRGSIPIVDATVRDGMPW